MSFDKEKIGRDVIALVAEQLKVSADSIKGSDTLESLGADSLDRVEIIMKTEEHFDIEINDADAENIKTIDGLIECVARSPVERS